MESKNLELGEESLPKVMTVVTEKNLIDEKTIKDYLFGSETKLTEQQQLLFIQTAKAFNLNPFKKEIYAYASGGKLTMITGYEVYLKRAEDTGKLDGWKVELLTSANHQPSGAKITIYRKDWKYPFEHSVSMTEYKLGNALWNTKPNTMIKKVTIGQGFRLCFPNELGGMPYLPEELPDNKTEKNEKPDLSEEQKKFLESSFPKKEYPVDPPLSKQGKPVTSTAEQTDLITVESVEKKDGISKDGISKDGTSKDGTSKDGTSKGGTSKGGKPYTIYKIFTIPDAAGNKQHYTTFSETFATIAKTSIGKNKVKVSFVVGQYGNDLKNIVPVEESKKAVEDLPF